MNKVWLTGNLTKDPELRRTQSGKSRTSFGIAVQRGIKRDEVDFFNLVAWEKTAEFITKYFAKGSRIIIEGRLQNNNYTDSRGVKHYGVDVIVESVEFGGSKKAETTLSAPVNDMGFDEEFEGVDLPEGSMPF